MKVFVVAALYVRQAVVVDALMDVWSIKASRNIKSECPPEYQQRAAPSTLPLAPPRRPPLLSTFARHTPRRHPALGPAAPPLRRPLGRWLRPLRSTSLPALGRLVESVGVASLVKPIWSQIQIKLRPNYFY